MSAGFLSNIIVIKKENSVIRLVFATKTETVVAVQRGQNIHRMQSQQNSTCCIPLQKTRKKAAITYFPTTSVIEFSVQIYSYGKLITMSISTIHILHNLEYFICRLCEGNKKMSFLYVTSQSKQMGLVLAKTDRIMQCNEQRKMNDLVEIVFAEEAGLRLCRLKIQISCC